MSETPKHNPEQDRPQASPEQLQAFHKAYSQLMLKARENGDEVNISPDESVRGKSIARITDENRDTLEPNGVGGSTLLSTPTLGEVYGWVYTHGEELVHNTGRLGSFTVTTDKGGNEQDMYEFYADGNIEKLHWIEGSYDQDSEAAMPHSLEHISWLTAQETEELSLIIEEAHFEFYNTPAE